MCNKSYYLNFWEFSSSCAIFESPPREENYCWLIHKMLKYDIKVERPNKTWKLSRERGASSGIAHDSENLSLFAVFPCHIPPQQILTIQEKVRRTRQLQSFLKHDVNARSNRFHCIMFGSCSIWRREFPAPSSPHKSLVINFSPARRTSFFSKLRRPLGLPHHESFSQSGVFRAWKSCPPFDTKPSMWWFIKQKQKNSSFIHFWLLRHRTHVISDVARSLVVPAPTFHMGFVLLWESQVFLPFAAFPKWMELK